VYRGSAANPNIMILKDYCVFTPSVGDKDGLELVQRPLLLGEMLQARATIFPFTFASSFPQTSPSNLPGDIVSLVLAPYGSKLLQTTFTAVLLLLPFIYFPSPSTSFPSFVFELFPLQAL
jgi:hypothetical protein